MRCHQMVFNVKLMDLVNHWEAYATPQTIGPFEEFNFSDASNVL